MAQVFFTNQSVNADTYAWDFGDGSTSPNQSPAHSYASPGTYVVRLASSGPGGQSKALKVVPIRGGESVNFISTSNLDPMATTGGDLIYVP